MVARQLDKHTIGYITYRAGMQSSMTTTVIRETENSKAVITIQVLISSSCKSPSFYFNTIYFSQWIAFYFLIGRLSFTLLLFMSSISGFCLRLGKLTDYILMSMILLAWFHILGKLFLLKKFISKCFAHLWEPITFQLIMGTFRLDYEYKYDFEFQTSDASRALAPHVGWR